MIVGIAGVVGGRRHEVISSVHNDVCRKTLVYFSDTGQIIPAFTLFFMQPATDMIRMIMRQKIIINRFLIIGDEEADVISNPFASPFGGIRFRYNDSLIGSIIVSCIRTYPLSKSFVFGLNVTF